MKKYILVLMMSFITLLNFAFELDIFGYYENQTSMEFVDNETNFLTYNKFRLDFNKDIAEDITFNSNIVFNNYNGAKEINLLNYFPDKVVTDYLNQTEMSISDIANDYQIKMEDDIILDNVYLSIYSKHFNAIIGKQQIALGTGYAWNPTDIYNSKNILDPTYEKKGVNALKLEIPYSMNGTFSTAISIDKNWEASTKSIQVDQTFLGYDFQFNYSGKQLTQMDYYSFVESKNNQNLFGFSFAGTLLGLGIWSETAYNKISHSDNFTQSVFGLDYTFENGLSLMSEYYYNELGEENSKNYNFNSWSDLFANGTNLGQNYLYFGESYSLGELTDLSNNAIINIDDQSVNYIPRIDYSFSDNLEFVIMASLGFGNADSEFANFNNGIFGRIKVYF